MPVLVYISHARQDEPLCKELVSHLAPLMRPGRQRVRLRTREVPAGCDAEATRRGWLDEAQLILLLISSDYMTECHAEEEHAIERLRAGRAQVIPILVRDLHIRGTYEQVARLSPLPDNRVAVMNTKWQRRDEAWANVARGIDRAVEDIERRQSAPRLLHPVVPGPGGPSMPPASTLAPAYRSPMPSHGVAPSQQQRGWGRAQFRGLIGLILLIGLIGVYFMLSRETSAPGAPRAASGSAPAGDTCGAPCCGGKDCLVSVDNAWKTDACPADGGPFCMSCASGRTCNPGSCKRILDPDQTYAIRLARALVAKMDPSTGSQICARRSGTTEYACISYAQAADLPQNKGRKTPTWMNLKIGDLMVGQGLDIQIRDGQSLAAAGTRVAHDNIGIVALCRGLKLPLPGTGTEVQIYLDDVF
jgi:hypothetical protein